MQAGSRMLQNNQQRNAFSKSVVNRFARLHPVLGNQRTRGRTAMVLAAAASSKDLLIVGPGVLGGYAGKLWTESFPEATVVAQTNTSNSHERWVVGGHPLVCGMTRHDTAQGSNKRRKNQEVHALRAIPPFCRTQWAASWSQMLYLMVLHARLQS